MTLSSQLWYWKFNPPPILRYKFYILKFSVTNTIFVLDKISLVVTNLKLPVEFFQQGMWHNYE